MNAIALLVPEDYGTSAVSRVRDRLSSGRLALRVQWPIRGMERLRREPESLVPAESAADHIDVQILQRAG